MLKLEGGRWVWERMQELKILKFKKKIKKKQKYKQKKKNNNKVRRRRSVGLKKTRQIVILGRGRNERQTEELRVRLCLGLQDGWIMTVWIHAAWWS